MSNIRNIVKVINFHSLIRVDKARQEASKYFSFETEIIKMIYSIINNKNLKLDKKILIQNDDGIVLNIYVGNDLGFCGNFNSQLRATLKKDTDSYKIVIGKKLFNIHDDKILLKIEKDNFLKESSNIDAIIKEYLLKRKIKEVNVIYNRYQSISEIFFEKRKIFPIDLDDLKNDDIGLDSDFVIETNVEELITNMISLYICYQIKVYESNSWASENVMRERITKESLKKIDELEEEKVKKVKKEVKDIKFKKQISNYRGIMEEW